MMRVFPRDRLSVKDALADTRLPGRTIALLVPAFVECPICGYDETQDTGFDPSCATCGGLGRTATWATSQIYANVRYVDAALMTYGQTPPGARVGDTILSIGLRDYAEMLRVYNTKDSYIWLDSQAMRPTAIQNAGLGQTEEHVVVVAAFQPPFRATGY